MSTGTSNEVDIQVNFWILSATDLPKTDMLSPIDAYFMFTPNTKSVPLKTQVIEDNSDPIFNSEFSVTIPYNPTTSTFSKITFELWDSNTVSKDEKVGIAELVLLPSHLQGKHAFEIPIKHENPKYAKHKSTLTLRFDEYAYSCLCLYNILKPVIPGVVYEKNFMGRLYIPLRHLGPIGMALEYAKGGLDIKIYATKPNVPLYIDVVRKGIEGSRIKRRTTQAAFEAFEGVTVFEEIKLEKVPFSVASEKGSVQISVYNKELEIEESLARIAIDHGWVGGMNYQKASEKLQNIELDPAEQQVFMKHDDTLVVIDYKNDGMEMNCLVLENPSNTSVGYSFSHTGNDVRRIWEYYNSPKKILNDKYTVLRKLSLDNFPYGTQFSEVMWHKYKTSGLKQMSLCDLVKLHPF